MDCDLRKSDVVFAFFMLLISTVGLVLSCDMEDSIKTPIERCNTVSLVTRYEQQVGSVVKLLRADEALGTGFFIDENTILTAGHVVRGVKTIKVYFKDNPKAYKGVVVDINEVVDMGLIKVNLPFKVKPLKLSKTQPVVGEKIYVIGHPHWYLWSLTHGIISHINRESIRDEIDGFIQVDAPVNGGNSGGPIFNYRGEVIGVVSYGDSQADGISMASPIKYVNRLKWKHNK